MQGLRTQVCCAPPNVMGNAHDRIRVDDLETGLLSRLTRDPSGDRGGYREEFRSLYTDKTLTCADCGQQFVFTASEQDFYAQRGFTEPRRCPSCRASRKAARNANGGGGAGSSSSYGSYGAGGGDFAGGHSGGGGGGGGLSSRGRGGGG